MFLNKVGSKPQNSSIAPSKLDLLCFVKPIKLTLDFFFEFCVWIVGRSVNVEGLEDVEGLLIEPLLFLPNSGEAIAPPAPPGVPTALPTDPAATNGGISPGVEEAIVMEN